MTNRIRMGAALLAAAQVLFTVLIALQATAQQKTALTVDDVMAMIKAGFSENIVLARIKAENKPFNLTTGDMVRLKNAGATDRILEAMIAPPAPSVSTSANATAGNQPATILSGIWNGTVIEKGAKYESKLVLSQTGINLAGNLTLYRFHGIGALQISITSGLLTGNEISLAGQAQMAGGTIQMDFSGPASESSIQGKLNFTVSSLMGTGTEGYTLQVFRAAPGKEPSAAMEPPPQPSGDTARIPPRQQSITAACADYDACWHAGQQAFIAHNWPQALADLHRATEQHPSGGEAWAWLGKTYLAVGRTGEFAAAWDKALTSGFPLVITACHEQNFRNCELGKLRLSPKTISYEANGQTVFSVAPSEVVLKGINAYNGATLRIGTRNYSLIPFPGGVECGINVVLVCPQEGVAQQLAIANYILQTLPKLASGALGANTSADYQTIQDGRTRSSSFKNMKPAVQ